MKENERNLDRPSPGPPIISVFFYPLPPQNSFSSSFSRCLLVEFWWCFWKSGNTNVHVWALWLSCETPAAPPDRAGGARTRQPENSKRAYLSAPALHHQNSTRRPPEREEKNEFCGEGKKARNFGPPPTLRGPTLPAPTLRAPTGFGPWLASKKKQSKITKKKQLKKKPNN